MVARGIATEAENIDFALIRAMIREKAFEATALFEQEIHPFLCTYLSERRTNVDEVRRAAIRTRRGLLLLRLLLRSMLLLRVPLLPWSATGVDDGDIRSL